MTAKRFTIKEIDNFSYGIKVTDIILDKDGIELSQSTVCDLLNEQHETIERLKQNIDELLSVDIEEELLKENEQLKSDVYDWKASAEDYLKLGKSLKRENEQLQARNDRQAKRLDRLYQLIGEKDWRTLSDILDDFKKAEEQLQREWQTCW